MVLCDMVTPVLLAFVSRGLGVLTTLTTPKSCEIGVVHGHHVSQNDSTATTRCFAIRAHDAGCITDLLLIRELSTSSLNSLTHLVYAATDKRVSSDAAGEGIPPVEKQLTCLSLRGNRGVIAFFRL